MFIFSNQAKAEITPTQLLVNDIARTYGFYIGQQYSLTKIIEKNPSLLKRVTTAEMMFDNNFKASLQNMNTYMNNVVSKKEWGKIKKQLLNSVTSSLNTDLLHNKFSEEFIMTVIDRAKGNIETPVLETLLSFKPTYQENPEREHLDGYTYKYKHDGSDKAKDVEFSIKIPISWKSEEADRPNIVRKFKNINGHGTELFMILIKSIPNLDGYKFTSKDIKEILNTSDMKGMLPKGSEYIESGELTIEGYPGYYVKYKLQQKRMRLNITVEAINYNLFYNDKYISLQGQVFTHIDGKLTNKNTLKKFEKLFDQIANSLVILNRYD